MNINRNNYEIWFLDYFEGRLSKEQVDELMAFLELHYDLKEEFDSFENVALPAEQHIVFDAKDSLKKNTVISVGAINESNYEEYFIGEIENDLTSDQSQQLASFLEKNPQMKKDFDLFSKVKVSPDASIVFKGKADLKKTVIVAHGAINETNYTDHFIAAAEGEATLSQLSELKVFLSKNPQLNKEYDLFRSVRLTPDTSIVFDRKSELKHAVITKKLFNLTKVYYPVSIAASIILLLAIYFLMPGKISKTIETASRSDFHVKRRINKNPEVPAAITYSENSQYIASATVPIQNNTNYNNIEPVKFEYTSAIPVKNVALISEEHSEELSEITIYEDFYAMMTRKRIQAEEQKQDQNKPLTLKEFALFKLKKSITPADKKDKVTPENSKITLWDVADAGVSKLNDLTGANARLDRKKDNSGYSLAFGNKFEFARSRNTNK